jgi:hypothetical protein
LSIKGNSMTGITYQRLCHHKSKEKFHGYQSTSRIFKEIFTTLGTSIESGKLVSKVTTSFLSFSKSSKNSLPQRHEQGTSKTSI